MEKTIEQKIADVILERNVTSLDIDGKTYNVAPPSIATLILVSEIISTLPVVEAIDPKDEERSIKVFRSVLHHAQYFRPLGDIAAILILGAKGLTEEVVVERKERRFFGLFPRKVKTVQVINRKAELAKIILENVNPAELFNLLLNKINALDLGNFFVITTSLTEANILKPTREVED